MGITVTSPALRLVHVVWSLQTPTKEFLKYFLPSKPNHLSHSKKTSVRLPSSLAIPSGMLATNHPGGHRATSPPTVIALSLLLHVYTLFLYVLLYFCCLFLSFVSPAPYHGHLYWWPWYMTWAFVYNLFCLLDILLCLFIFLPIKID